MKCDLTVRENYEAEWFLNGFNEIEKNMNSFRKGWEKQIGRAHV